MNTYTFTYKVAPSFQQRQQSVQASTEMEAKERFFKFRRMMNMTVILVKVTTQLHWR
jgi:hypothetical protein